jgi:Ca-activated chloride channel family protein
MEEIISGLRPDDLMNVILFSGGSAVLADRGSLKATKENKDKAVAWIRSQQGGGGTELLPALRRALDLPRTEGVSRVVVVATDGYVSVEPQAFELIRSTLGQANLFTFGIGTAVNRQLIEGMARVGRGESFVVLNQAEAPKQAARFRRYIESPVLTNITLSFRDFKARDVEPAAVPDLFALRPVVVFGKYEGEPSGEIVIAGKTARGDFKKLIRIENSMALPGNSALRLLWARHRIMELSDLNLLREEDTRTKEVTDLGLRYSLLTQYTSFVAVDKVKRADGEIVTVKEPLPMPEGVSDLAVGGMTRAAAAPAGLAKCLATAAPAAESRAFEAQKTVDKGDESNGKLTTEKIEVRVVEVKGDLDRGAIEQVLRNILEELSGCCSKDASRKELKGGEITYRLLVKADGKVAEVRPVASTPAYTARTKGLTKVLRSLIFPPLTRGDAEIVLTVVCRIAS